MTLVYRELCFSEPMYCLHIGRVESFTEKCSKKELQLHLLKSNKTNWRKGEQQNKKFSTEDILVSHPLKDNSPKGKLISHDRCAG